MRNKFSWKEVIKGAVCLPFFSAFVGYVLHAILKPQESIWLEPVAFLLYFPMNLGIIFLAVGLQSLILSAILESLRSEKFLRLIAGIVGIIIIPLTYKCTKMTQFSVFLGGAITLYILFYRPKFIEKIFSKIE